MTLPLELLIVELYRRIALSKNRQLRRLKHTGGEDTLQLVRSHLFKEQLEFVSDPSRQKAALCSRRSGKTMAGASLLVEPLLQQPGSYTAYYAPTRTQAKKLMWPLLKWLKRNYQLRLRFNETELIVKDIDGGGEIYLLGADKQTDIDKARGLALHTVILDEAQSYKPANLKTLIEDVLVPTLEDYKGTAVMTGTPGPVCNGFFHDVTTDAIEGWSVHKWTVFQNSKFPQWADQKGWAERAKTWFRRFLKEKGWTDVMPHVQREWFGLWVRDEGALVYAYDPETNYIDELPPGFQWQYGLGLDLGVMALVVHAWHPNHPILYYIHAEKHRGWGIEQMGAQARHLRDKYKPRYIVADTGALGKYIIRDITKRFGMAIEPAEKKGKQAYQAVFNADLRQGLIKVLPEANPMVEEMSILQRRPDGSEDPDTPKDCCDAALYIHRKARHIRWKPQTTTGRADPAKIWEYYKERELVKSTQRKLRNQGQQRAKGVPLSQLRGRSYGR